MIFWVKSILKNPRASNRIKMRRSRVSDIELLVNHRRKMWLEIWPRAFEGLRNKDGPYRKWLHEMVKKRRFVGFIATVNQKRIAGSGGIWLREVHPRPGLTKQRAPYLLSMYTEPEFRGLGVASAIVKEAMKWCKKNGYNRVTLHASRKGRKVYTKLGWKRTWEMRAEL
jgi:GNAT superfamily N-acetyltransferase